ncbi:MAG: hypothetical protein K8T89_08310 [Planctomycetes bacterium]|nr:hypothetical protein [Planctomycetota bacterium]
MDERLRTERWARFGVACGAILIALFAARPYADSWNDASRLATVESLVEQRTLVIDNSIFVKPGANPSPFRADSALLQAFGTKDKLFINGHFYSDKSPVPAFHLALVDQIWRWFGGPSASTRPDWFCRVMTWFSSGLAYVISICCFFAISRRIGLNPRTSLLITAFFALGTIALPYVEHVNNHILLLGVASCLFLVLLTAEQEGWTTRRLVGIGVLLGIGYTIDLAAGPMLGLTVAGLLAWRANTRKKIWLVALAAMPFFFFHHVVNYRTGGTLGPANAVAAYFEWPGSPFNPGNMTGGWKHSSVLDGLRYSLDMMFGKKGFFGHNLILFLPLLALPTLLRNRTSERPILITGLLWSVGTWLLYAATSNNQSGGCCSVRWFVPLLAPGFVALALILRERPEFCGDAILLGCGGIALGVGMAIRGPWFAQLMPFYWYIYAGTMFGWIGYQVYLRRVRVPEINSEMSSTHADEVLTLALRRRGNVSPVRDDRTNAEVSTQKAF